MEDRSLTFDFEKGGIKGVWLKASLDQTYKKLFENAYKSSKKYPKNVTHGIKIIIFGCFWLESYANELLRMILQFEISSAKLQEEIWNKLKRDPIEEKFSFFFKLLPSELQQKYSVFKNLIKRTFDLRGQLAHYKNEPQKIANEITPEDAYAKILQNLPVPELNQQLMWNNVKTREEAIRNTSKWLGEIATHYQKAHHIINKHKKIKR